MDWAAAGFATAAGLDAAEVDLDWAAGLDAAEANLDSTPGLDAAEANLDSTPGLDAAEANLDSTPGLDAVLRWEAVGRQESPDPDLQKSSRWSKRISRKDVSSVEVGGCR